MWLQAMHPSKKAERRAKQLAWEQSTVQTPPGPEYKGPTLTFPLTDQDVFDMGMPAARVKRGVRQSPFAVEAGRGVATRDGGGASGRVAGREDEGWGGEWGEGGGGLSMAGHESAKGVLGCSAGGEGA